MVNIRIRFPYKIDGSELVNTICEGLRGNRAFIENDIVVNDDDKKEKTILISLGDDADQNPRVVNVEVKLDEISKNF